MQAQDLSLLVESYCALHPQRRGQARVSLFLDEIQVVPGWDLFACRLLDEENAELVLSGSSARLLAREVATSMRGRAMEALVHPFSFRDGLRHQQREPPIAPARRRLGCNRFAKILIIGLINSKPWWMAFRLFRITECGRYTPE